MLYTPFRRPEKRDGAKDLPPRVPACLGHHGRLRLRPELEQAVELGQQQGGPHSGSALELGKPHFSPRRAIDRHTRRENAACAEDGLDAEHHALWALAGQLTLCSVGQTEVTGREQPSVDPADGTHVKRMARDTWVRTLHSPYYRGNLMRCLCHSQRLQPRAKSRFLLRFAGSWGSDQALFSNGRKRGIA